MTAKKVIPGNEEEVLETPAEVEAKAKALAEKEAELKTKEEAETKALADKEAQDKLDAEADSEKVDEHPKRTQPALSELRNSARKTAENMRKREKEKLEK